MKFIGGKEKMFIMCICKRRVFESWFLDVVVVGSQCSALEWMSSNFD